MKCPKCGYTSFAYRENCLKCSQGLAGQQAAFGLYALRPNPPDLLMAYQAAQMDNDDTTLETPSLPSLAIDLSQLVEIELDLAAAEEPPPVSEIGAGQAGDAVDLAPTIPVDFAPELEPLEAEPHTEPTNPSAGGTPPSFDLSEPRDITFELEPAADLGASGSDLHSLQEPPASPEESPVYDLDLEEGPEGLTLGPEVHDSRADEDTAEDESEDEGIEETAEYILEIEDELELEIDEIELEEPEENDDGSGEDDNAR
jgi:hypothetical protein